MVKLLNGTAAFLHNGNKYLLLKRSENKKIAPGLWSGIGGKLEPNELNNPLASCYREIEEETGIVPTEIKSLNLLYILIRRFGQNEIRQSYIYFGETSRTEDIEIMQTDEGQLSWILSDQLTNREYSKTFAEMLNHYKNRQPDDKRIYIGVFGSDEGKMTVNWTISEDFE
ncbi:MAG: NUDIX domain-containing protein [Defluviitaleaceae bacterium]|nr:NUDIX domain-containing protein [Defluviitaleaceae bacterium]